MRWVLTVVAVEVRLLVSWSLLISKEFASDELGQVWKLFESWAFSSQQGWT